MITEPAPAKINLALHVRRRRADGYHDLETLFTFCAEGDEVRIELSKRNSFKVSGPFATALGHPHPSTLRVSPSPDGRGKGPAAAGGGKGEGEWRDNLATRAADAFAAALAIDAAHAITLDKRLPVASGIGGGSADAAATLRALARLHGVTPDDPRLVAIAASLGADVPACLIGRTALGTGRGDDLQPLEPLGDVPVLLVNPGVAVSTAAVFAHWDGVDRGPIAPGDPLTAAAAGRNDLEPPARAIAPVIGDVLGLLAAAPGATLARMSGSGATCFALFDNAAERDAAATAARERGWWTLTSVLA